VYAHRQASQVLLSQCMSRRVLAWRGVAASAWLGSHGGLRCVMEGRVTAGKAVLVPSRPVSARQGLAWQASLVRSRCVAHGLGLAKQASRVVVWPVASGRGLARQGRRGSVPLSNLDRAGEPCRGESRASSRCSAWAGLGVAGKASLVAGRRVAVWQASLVVGRRVMAWMGEAGKSCRVLVSPVAFGRAKARQGRHGSLRFAHRPLRGAKGRWVTQRAPFTKV
jgi:hypothetical protein